jgi:hypothetical protein
MPRPRWIERGRPTQHCGGVEDRYQKRAADGCDAWPPELGESRAMSQRDSWIIIGLKVKIPQ